MKWKRILAGVIAAVLLCTGIYSAAQAKDPGYIRYAEFNVPYSALCRAMDADIACEGKVSWIDTLAYLGARYGGEWKRYRQSDFDAIQKKLADGEKIEELTKDTKYFSYFRNVYEAVLGGWLGWYLQEGKDGAWTTHYGLRVFSPIADGYWYQDFDDFGASRSYGFNRQHTGHDLMGSVGTPVIAVESGTVEMLGWNQYGGWRIGIRTDDHKRYYYYYAHLRKDHRYQEGLCIGTRVTAGDVIGYLGQTGYSHKENVNGITTPHLHFGLELVFNEAQKESDNEIWVDVYALTRALSQHRASVIKEGKEYQREYGFLLCTISD